MSIICPGIRSASVGPSGERGGFRTPAESTSWGCIPGNGQW